METECFRLEVKDKFKHLASRALPLRGAISIYMVKCSLEENETTLGLGSRKRWYRWDVEEQRFILTSVASYFHIDFIKVEPLEILSVSGQNVKNIEDLVPKP